MSTFSLVSAAAQPLPTQSVEPADGEGRSSFPGEASFADILRQVAGTGYAFPLALDDSVPPGDGSSDDGADRATPDAGAAMDAAEWTGLLLMEAGLTALPVSVTGSETGADSNRSVGSVPGPAPAPARDSAPVQTVMDSGVGSQKTAGVLVDDWDTPDRRPAPAQGASGSDPVALPAEHVAAASDAGQPIANETAPRQADGLSVGGRLLQGLPAESDGDVRSAYAEDGKTIGAGALAGEEGGPGRAALGNAGAISQAAHRTRSHERTAGGVTGEGRQAAPLLADAVLSTPTLRDAGAWGTASAGDPVPVERFAEEATPVFLRALQMHASGQATEARILLVPKELGKVDVQLAVHNGHVTLTFAVDTPAAKEALESQIPQLRWQLEQQGLVLDKVAVIQGMSGGLAFFHGFSHGHRGALPYPHGVPRRAHAAYGGEETVDAFPTASILAAGVRVSRVDYSV